MIHLLAEYCRQQGIPAESGFGTKRVRWAICCDAQGRYTGLLPLGDVNSKNNPGQEFRRCPDLTQGELIGGGGSRSHFLADSARVAVLLSKPPVDPDLVAKHVFFRDLIGNASIALPVLVPVATLLNTPAELEKVRADCDKKVKPDERVTFRVESVIPLDQDFWHDWWRNYRERLAEPKVSSIARHRCFITGEVTEPERTHLKITGLTAVGGQPAGDVLIGFDKPAFCSFNFNQGENASISSAGMTEYRAGLNELLSRSSVRIGNSRIAFWFKDRIEEDQNPMWALLGSSSKVEDGAVRQRVIEFLRSVHTGRSHPLNGNRYYALTLSGAGGRVMVRGWMEGSFESLATSVDRWFADLQIVSRFGDSFAMPSSLDGLSYNCLSLRSQRSNERKQTDDERRRLSQPLLHAALTGSKLSDLLPARILACLRSEIPSADTGQEDTPLQPNRFAVLRAYLVRFFEKPGDNPMSDSITPALNPALPSAAYHCGRILAILAALQKRALGSVGAGVIQRYYASASTNPGLVFGRLLKNAQYHIDKLGPDKSSYFEYLLAQTMTCIPNDFPRVLSLQEQGLFGLGYYHQIADLRKKHVVTGDDQDTSPEEMTSDDSGN